MKKKLKAVEARIQAKEKEKNLSTSERLVRDLKALNDPKLENIITRAEEGYYDDFKTPIAFLTIALVSDLEQAGYSNLANNAKEGKWSSTVEEGREWFEEEGWDLLKEDVEKNEDKTINKVYDEEIESDKERS